MKTTKLGSSDIDIPIICLGTMTWGQQNTLEEAHAQLDYAIKERGLTFLDTAEIYPIPPTSVKQGLTEEYIGKWLEKNGNRESLIIASKVAPASLIRTRDVGTTPKLDKKNITEAVDGSLKRLKTDYIDLYQIHWPVRQTNFFGARAYEHSENDNSTPIEETLEVLQELIKAGKIRNIGVSNETSWGVSEYLRLHREKNLPKIVSIQNQYSLTNRTFEIGLSEFCRREDIGMLPYSTLNMGVLTGKYLDGARPKGARFSVTMRNSARYNPDNPYAQQAIKKYVDLAKKHNLDPAELAIAFAASRDFVSSVIIGATKIDQLKTCIDAGEIEISQEILHDIDTLYKTYPDVTV
jgi:aryl-alcohol dehydrogenase-like predicted oxidoreductase